MAGSPRPSPWSEPSASPLIAPRVELTRREIRTPTGWLKVVASDGPKQHGLILSLAIVDELHAHRDAELYLALRTGLLKRRDSRIVTISTAASDEDSPLGELRRRALDLPEVRAEGSFTEAYGSNLAFMEWSLPEAASIETPSSTRSLIGNRLSKRETINGRFPPRPRVPGRRSSLGRGPGSAFDAGWLIPQRG